MRNIIFGVIISFCSLLSGCTTFGVDNQTWQQLSPQEKQIAMQNYYRNQAAEQQQQAEIDKINAQNAPLNNAISEVATAIEQSNKPPRGRYRCLLDGDGVKQCGYGCHHYGYFNQVHCDQPVG